MHRLQLINLLEQYHPADAQEILFKQQMLTFTENNPDCFERSLQHGHITASCWLLNHDETQALLMHHRKLNNWFQLGGHCDGDSNTLAVAIKEAQEESGIKDIVALDNAIFDIDIHLIPENIKEKAHYHYDVRFLLKVVGNQKIVQNHESKELRWISKDLQQLPTQNGSILRMFHKWIQRSLTNTGTQSTNQKSAHI